MKNHIIYVNYKLSKNLQAGNLQVFINLAIITLITSSIYKIYQLIELISHVQTSKLANINEAAYLYLSVDPSRHIMSKAVTACES